jgi:hypothetical protein
VGIGTGAAASVARISAKIPLILAPQEKCGPMYPRAKGVVTDASHAYIITDLDALGAFSCDSIRS